VGEPENKENYEVHNKEEVFVYVAKGFPENPPKIILQLKKSRSQPPMLVASRRH